MTEVSRRDTTPTLAAGSNLVDRVRTDLAVSSVASPHASRRGLLSCLAPAALVLAGAGTAVAAQTLQPDAELIRVCHQFAEAEFASWYAYIVTDDGEVESRYENAPPDWATLHWIEATPATTPEGLRAKALAFVAWHRNAFDNCVDDRDGHTTLLASLMRDLAAPARAVIVARLVEQYGPLPKDYTADGVWLGAEART